MAELITLARPYAKAAFEYAKEMNAIAEWEEFLESASRVVSNKDFADFLNNPTISVKQKANILMDIIALNRPVGDSPMKQMLKGYSVQLPEGVSVDDLVQQVASKQKPIQSLSNFIIQLAENDRLALLPEIGQHYAKLKSQNLKQIDAYVTTAFALSKEQKQMLQDRLAKSEQAVIVLHEIVDASLLGGVTIKVGDKFTDGSIKGRLKQLKTQLSS